MTSFANEARVNTKRLRLAGLRINPPASLYEGVDLEQVDRVLRSERPDLSELPSAPSPVTAVFVDEEGNHFLLRETENGPEPVPFTPDAESELGSPEMMEGGYVSMASIGAAESAPDPTSEAVARAAREAVRRHAASSGGVEALARSMGTGLAQQAATGVLASLAGGGSAAGGLAAMLPQLGSGGGGLAGLASQGLQMGASNALGMGMSALMGAWAPDADADAGEQIAHKMVGDMAGLAQSELQSHATEALGDMLPSDLGGVGSAPSDAVASPAESESIEDRVSEFFSGPTSGAAQQVLRVGDVDAKGNAIVSGLPTVTVAGAPLARLGDAVEKKGEQVYMGAATVTGGGQMVGMQGVSMSKEGSFPMGAPTVFVGGPAGGIAPPQDQQPSDAASGSSTSSESGKGGSDSSQDGSKDDQGTPYLDEGDDGCACVTPTDETEVDWNGALADGGQEGAAKGGTLYDKQAEQTQQKAAVAKRDQLGRELENAKRERIRAVGDFESQQQFADALDKKHAGAAHGAQSLADHGDAMRLETQAREAHTRASQFGADAERAIARERELSRLYAEADAIARGGFRGGVGRTVLRNLPVIDNVMDGYQLLDIEYQRHAGTMSLAEADRGRGGVFGSALGAGAGVGVAAGACIVLTGGACSIPVAIGAAGFGGVLGSGAGQRYGGQVLGALRRGSRRAWQGARSGWRRVSNWYHGE